MRHRLLILALLFIIACTGNRTDIAVLARQKVHAYLSAHIPHIAGYRAVSTTAPDSIVKSYLNDKTYLRLEDSVMEIEAIRFREMGENFALYKQRETQGWYQKRQQFFKIQQDSVVKTCAPRFAGYKVEHRFIAANNNGSQVLNTYVFCFTKKGKLKRVIK